MFNYYPLFIIIFDIFFGLLFWTFITKFFLHLFFSNETNVKFVSSFFSITNRIYNKLNRIIPSFLPTDFTMPPMTKLPASWFYAGCHHLRGFYIPAGCLPERPLALLQSRFSGSPAFDLSLFSVSPRQLLLALSLDRAA